MGRSNIAQGRLWRVSLVLVMVLGFASLPSQRASAAAVLYVKPSAVGSGDCSAWEHACTLQTALGDAVSGDEIWVMGGTYKPTTGTARTATFQLRTGVAVYGGFAGTETAREDRDPEAHTVTLSGDIGTLGTKSDNVYHVVAGADGALLDGVSITAGNATGVSPDNVGGGMINVGTSPTLKDVIFSNNAASYRGGGMYNNNSSPTLRNVTFTGNTATSYDGGGMYNYNGSPALTDVLFNYNTAEYHGGGLYNWLGSPTLDNVIFDSNVASQGDGGGIYNYDCSASPTLTDVTFSSNQAFSFGGGMTNWFCDPALNDVTFDDNFSWHWGGGLHNTSSDPTLNNVTFFNNRALESGGGMLNDTSNPSLVNVTFSDNSAIQINGGGMLNTNSSPSLTNVTFHENSADDNGGGMYNDASTPTLLNAIFWGNAASTGPQISNVSSTPVVRNSIIQDGYPGGTNILTADPLLGALGDYGGSTQTLPLLPGSSAIDTGDDSFCPSFDQRGVGRPQGAHCDIGAYEYVDVTPPMVTAFTVPASSVSHTIPITAFTASDDTHVTGYLITTSATPPSAVADGWAGEAPASFAFTADGVYTLYPWAKDASGNVSLEFASPPVVVVDTIAPDTQIDSQPANPSSDTSASFMFSSIDGCDSFECQLDGGGYEACTSPQDYSCLSNGQHSFDVRAIDSAGNIDPTSASYTWTIDSPEPDTKIDSQPKNPSSDASVEFEFISSDDSATFECQLDRGGYSACTSPQTYTKLSEGEHIFEVRAVDAEGDKDLTPASYTWTIDVTAPDTQISSQPANPSSDTFASFEFSSLDSTASFECQLDAGGYAPCTSPLAYTGLSEGQHTFEVRAVDTAGNMDNTPASFTWTIDVKAPDTQIDSHPIDPSRDTSASFAFSSSDGAATFECQLDGGGFSPCTSPQHYTSLTEGEHTFEVRARGAEGNVDENPTSFTWTIDLTPPSVLSSLPAARNNAATGSVDFTVTFSEAVTGVDLDDFSLTTTGSASAALVEVSGSGSVYCVTVNTGKGIETIRLDLPSSGTVTDLAGHSLSNLPFTSGKTYNPDDAFELFFPMFFR